MSKRTAKQKKRRQEKRAMRKGYSGSAVNMNRAKGISTNATERIEQSSQAAA